MMPETLEATPLQLEAQPRLELKLLISVIGKYANNLV